MDDQTGLVDVENNLVYRVSGFAMYTPHGPAAPNQANTIKNNILAFARLSMIADTVPYVDGVPTVAEQVVCGDQQPLLFRSEHDSVAALPRAGRMRIHRRLPVHRVSTVQQQPLLAHRWRLRQRCQGVPRAA